MTIYKENLVSHIEIFKIINNLKETYDNDAYAIVTLEKDIDFVNPFFLILLLQYQKQTNKFLILDILDCQEEIQGYLFTFLTQQIQFNTIKYPTTIKDYQASIFRRNEKYKEIYSRPRGEVPTIYLYITEKIQKRNYAFKFCLEEYTFLPILSLTNETKNSIEYSESRFEENITEECRAFYKSISVDFFNENEYVIGLKSALNQVVKGIKTPNYDNIGKLTKKEFNQRTEELNEDLSNIFFELIDNIKRHTEQKKEKKYANAFLSSRFNKYDAQYEYIISDDYTKGFIESFKVTLEENKKNIPSLILSDIKDSYIDIERKIDSKSIENDKAILNGIFGVKDTIGLREIQRVTMHFGIPMLLKLLQNVQGKLDIYVHHEESYYHISYDGSSDNPPIVESLKDNEDKIIKGAKGTHIYLTLPIIGLLDYLKKESLENIKQPLNIKNQTFKNIFNAIPDLKKEIDNFNYIPILDLENKLFVQKEMPQIIIKFPLDNDNKRTFNGTISDFIRALFAYAFFHNTIDIYVYNFPIDEYKTYLSIIVEKLYDATELNINIPNIIFQNSNSFDITFIGGETFKELLSINKNIAIEYNSNKKSIFGSTVKDVKPKIHEKSKLFFNLKSENIILPFILIQNKNLDENILGTIIINSLEKNSLNIHVDTKKGYHLNKFYQFKNLFSDSQWINRLAFVLAQQGNKHTYFLGTDKYTSLTIAVANSFLGHNEYLVVDNILNISDQKGIKNFIDKVQYKKPMAPCKRKVVTDYSKVVFNKKSNTMNNIIVFSSVSFSYENISKYILEYLKHKNFNTAAVISISLDNKKAEYPLFLISNLKLEKDRDYFDVEKDRCKICTCYTESKPLEEKPLYELDEVNTFSLKNFYKLPYELISKKSSVKIDSVLWHDSIHFVHARRGHNHYTFYTKTINFFQQNKKHIKFCLKHKIKKSITKLVNDRKIIIFAPRHSTNNNFITYVDEYLFNNNATVYRFDKENGEQNFYDIDFVDDDISNSSKTAVFFVDDEISSGYTMEYFYTLLRVKGGNRKFDASIVMIDRTTINDTKVLCNYIEGIDFTNKINNLYSFTKLEIKPIKTEIENCFLCEKQKDYKEKLVNNTLDMNRFQIAERIVKLNQTDAHSIDNFSHRTDMQTKLKIYLKMYAVDYVYRNFKNFHKMVIDYFKIDNDECNVVSLHHDYINEEKKLFDEVNAYLKKNFFLFDGDNQLIEEIFERICRYEINIALLKAISFPKLAYYEDIRKIATKIIICRLRSKIRANQESYKEVLDCSILQPFTSYDATKVTLFSTMFNDDEYSYLTKTIDNSDFKDFFTDYKNKNNLNYINFLYITAGYLNISYILAKENILFYNQVSNYSKIHNYSHDLLHIYPTAVKLITSKYADKARYFDQQLTEFFCDEIGDSIRTKWHPNFEHGTKRYSLVNALFLENTVNDSLKYTVDTESNLNNQLINLANEINKYSKQKFKDYYEKEQKIKCDNPRALTLNSKKFKIEKIFINEYMDRNYNDYIEYLEGSRLLDLLSEMKELEQDDIIYPLYLGAVSDETNTVTGLKYVLQDIDKKEEKESILKDNIDCTWSNMYINSYKLDTNEKQCTVIRLVDIDHKKLEKLSNEDEIKENKNLWFKPVGLIVASHDGDYTTHLVYSRILLSLQKYLIDFFKKKFDYGKFQEQIRSKHQLRMKVLEKQLEIALLKNKRQYELEQSRKEKKRIQKELENLYESLQDISHTYKDYISVTEAINKLEDRIENTKLLDMVKKYTTGLMYIFKIASLRTAGALSGANIKYLSHLLNEETGSLYKKLDNFLSVAPYFIFNSSENVKFKIHTIEKEAFKIKYNDVNKIEAVFFELLFNVIKQNKTLDKPINITIFIENDIIYVANDGLPIPKDMKKFIFTKGKSKDSARPEISAGLGLGLYYIKKYLKSLKLKIDLVENDIPDELSSCTVIFKIQK